MRNIITDSQYWQISRSTALSLIYVIPMWAVYQYLTFRANQGWGGSIRTGVDRLFTSMLQDLTLPAEFTVFVPIVFLLAFFLKKSNRLIFRDTRLGYFAGMFLESLLYGLVFGLLVGNITGIFLTPTGDDLAVTAKKSEIIMNIGSGLYEELVFRFILMSLLVATFRRIKIKKNFIIYSIAILTSSVIFAGFHNMELFTENFEQTRFIFRTIAGVVFSIIFILRGYGITAYSHSFYNIFLMLRV